MSIKASWETAGSRSLPDTEGSENLRCVRAPSLVLVNKDAQCCHRCSWRVRGKETADILAADQVVLFEHQIDKSIIL